MKREFHYRLFADYHQFYLQDDDSSKGDLSDSWTKEASERMLAVGANCLGIRTARNMPVQVLVTIYDVRPAIKMEEWDCVTAGSLQIDTGRIVVAGCTDYFPEAERIDVNPGTYEAIICYGNLDSLSEDGLEGEDCYHVNLFPGCEIAPVILKGRC